MDAWGKLEAQHATALLELWPECKRGAAGVLHGDTRKGTYPTASPVQLSFNRKDWQGQPPNSLNLFLDDATVGGTD